MAELATIAAVVGAVSSVAGGAVSAAGSLQQGRAAKEAADTEALQLEMKGREEFAAAQRDAFAKRKEGTLANSRLQALAAASGGGADDPTIIKLMSGISTDAEYNAQTELYGGKSRRAGLFDAASNRRREGQASLLGSRYRAGAALLGGIGGAAAAFG